MINSIIGSGIFGLPSIIARELGPAAVPAWIAAAAFVAIIIGCFAEAASRFTQPGGPYLYARAAFGRLLGIWTGWLTWAVRLAAGAAAANLFVIYLGEFWPQATAFPGRIVVLALLIGTVTVVNYRGVHGGTQLNNVFTVAKLLPLLLFIVVGGVYIVARHRSVPIGFAHAPAASWVDAFLLLVFAYGGFEGGLLPMGEAKDPRRDAPFGLGAALVTCALVYTLVQGVVMGVLPQASLSDRPLAAAARLLLGGAGASFMSVGALLSVYGYETSMMLNTPRLTFALAEQGDFPRVLAAVHPRFRTPYVSIIAFAVLLFLLAVSGSFQWNAILSAIARIFYYAIVCAAVLELRRRDPAEARFRLPGGPVLPVLGVLLSLVLVVGIRRASFLVLALVFAVSLLNWWWVRGRVAGELD